MMDKVIHSRHVAEEPMARVEKNRQDIASEGRFRKVPWFDVDIK